MKLSLTLRIWFCELSTVLLNFDFLYQLYTKFNIVHDMLHKQTKTALRFFSHFYSTGQAFIEVG